MAGSRGRGWFRRVRVHSPPRGPARAGRSFKIVVIGGGDAVNIIQQHTAVTPVVEVRDRNDLPVAGVPVTFSVTGAKTASFAGGAPTVTITTNAAGRAAASGFTPLTNGAVQINVSATLQGETVTATISQMNVAQAAQAASSGAQSTGAGGGGSGKTLALVAAAGGGAAGALALLRSTAESAAEEPPPAIQGQTTCGSPSPTGRTA